MDNGELAGTLLAWYDRNARAMPWRVPPDRRAAGERPDPYRVWLSEVMLQQTTVAAVRGHFHRFTARWPTVQALAAAGDAEVMGAWAGLGYYARARNLLACARAVVARGGFPQTRDGLLALPGIGPYTAAAIAAIAWDEPATVVDGNVERVMARLRGVTDPLPGARAQLVAHAAALTPRDRPGDHAQAVMDLGATICTPRNPACGICPWRGPCAARAQGIAADLPRKAPKTARPVRHGIAYVGRRADGAWLLETRPPSGLLGGMLGWPGTDWAGTDGPGTDGAGTDGAGTDGVKAPRPAPPLAADWQMAGAARHSFTHFHLTLSVHVAHLRQEAAPERGDFIPAARFDATNLPTVMRKVFAIARVALGQD